MGDFNIAQFLGGIVEGMGKGLTSDKGGGAMNMEVIPKKKNAPPVIEMTPSQTAASDVMKGAGTAAAMGQPILSPTAPAPPRRQQTNVVSDAEFDDTSTDPPKYDWSGAPIKYGHDLPEEGGWSGRSGRMRQMRSGGITEPGEEVIVHENEKVQGLPNGQVVVTPAGEVTGASLAPVADEYGNSLPVANNPQYPAQENVAVTANRDTGVTADRPPGMSLPDTVQQGPNDEGFLQNELLKNMEVKSSPWKDLGAALIQAGNNHFNNKNEPIRTWGEIQRDKKVAPLAAKLALVRDIKANRQAAEEKAARLGLITEQTKTIGRDDKRLTDNLERQKTKDAANEKMWERKLDQADVRLAQGSLKLAQDAELLRLRDKWALADDEISKRRLKLVEDEMANRMIRHDETMTERRLSREDMNKYRNAGLTLRQAGQAKGLTPKQAQDIADRKTKLKAALTEKVRAGKMTQDDMDEILSEKVDAGFGKATGDVDK